MAEGCHSFEIVAVVLTSTIHANFVADYRFVPSFRFPFVRSFVPSFLRSFVRSFVHSFVQSLGRSVAQGLDCIGSSHVLYLVI